MIFSRLKVCRSHVDFILIAVLGLMLVALVPHSAHAQSLDRIERERVDQMLQRLKDDLEMHYYDPQLPRHRSERTVCRRA